MNLSVILLAAGQGKRMHSKRPKVLHPLCGRPMIDFVLDAARELEPSQVIVVVEGEGPVSEHLRSRGVDFAFQPVRRGTGDAVRQAMASVAPESTHLLILNGDVPLLAPATLRRMAQPLSGDLRILAADLADPAGYGRVFATESGIRIVEEADASEEQRKNVRINAGVYFGSRSFFERSLPRLTNQNRQAEYYLTDLVAMASGCEVQAVEAEQEILGINNREQLSEVERLLRSRKNRELMLSGVTMRDPASTYVDWDVRVGADTVLYPGVTLEGSTQIGADCKVYPGVRVSSSQISDGCSILDGSVLESCFVGIGSQVGPMARLRPGTRLGSGCRIGNFVETKNAVFGDGSKSAHLSYLGDAEIGRDVNIGCGTITCNYDGVHKHRTILEDGVFVGSDTQFIAPVRVGRGAIVASGTTVTTDVPPEALVLTRAPLVIKEAYAARYWSRRREQASGKPRSTEGREDGGAP